MSLTSDHARHTPRPLSYIVVLAGALLAGLAALGALVVQQVRLAPGVSMAATAPGTRAAAAPIEPSGPPWGSLSAPQKQALAPLQERWASMGETQKRRWLALAHSFATLPESEQEKLHSRMSAWASLSAQQRSQARLNYAITRRMAPADKRAQWEAYQALSAEEKNRLAARAAPKPKGAATAIRPVAPRKLARIPAATETGPNLPNPPKIPPQAIARPAPPTTLPAPAPAPAVPAAAQTAPITMHAPVVAEPLPPLPATPAPTTAFPASPVPPASSPPSPPHITSPEVEMYRPN